eukprot:1193655-Prorocentrum_minimum.AAC.3
MRARGANPVIGANSPGHLATTLTRGGKGLGKSIWSGKSRRKNIWCFLPVAVVFGWIALNLLRQPASKIHHPTQAKPPPIAIQASQGTRPEQILSSQPTDSI